MKDPKKITIAVVVLVSIAYFFIQDKENTPVIIRDTQKEDSLKAALQVSQLQLIEDSLLLQSLKKENEILSKSLLDVLRTEPLTDSQVDSILIIAKQNQVK